MSEPNEITPLRGCVRLVLDGYFEHIDEKDATNIYHLFIEEVERPLIEKVYQRCEGNQSRTAKMLGINRGTLRKKLIQYEILEP